jgi:hypothetical protein
MSEGEGYLVQTGSDSVDHKAIAVVMDAYQEGLKMLADHYIDGKGEGPQKGSPLHFLFTQLLVSSVGSIILEVSPEMMVFIAQDVATKLIEYTRKAQVILKERDNV